MFKKIKRLITFYIAYNKGIREETAGNYEVAFGILLFAICLKSNLPEILETMIRTARKNRKYVEAKDFTETAIRKFPKNAGFYAQNADLNRLLKEYETAIEMYDKAIELDDRNIENYKNKAQIQYYTGDIQGAINDCNSAIARNDRCADLYAQRAFYKFEKKAYKNAIEDYSSAISLNPNKKHYYFMRAAAKILSGEIPGLDEDILKSKEFGQLLS